MGDSREVLQQTECRQDWEEGRDTEAREWRARGLYLFPVASHSTSLRLGEATETSLTNSAGNRKSKIKLLAGAFLQGRCPRLSDSIWWLRQSSPRGSLALPMSQGSGLPCHQLSSLHLRSNVLF